MVQIFHRLTKYTKTKAAHNFYKCPFTDTYNLSRLTKRHLTFFV